MIRSEPEDSVSLIRECLITLHMPFVASELLDIRADPEFSRSSPLRILAHLMQTETERRQKNRVTELMNKARFKYPEAHFDATLNDPERKLADTDIFWLKESFADEPGNVLITGCTGAGKSWTACALGIAAVQRGKKVRYVRTAQFLRELEQADETGCIGKAVRDAAKLDVLILDDFGLHSIDLNACRNLFEIIEERDPDKATIVVSQYPVKAWYDLFSDATYAEAILDRLVQRAKRVDMKGVNMRERAGEALR